jgi:mono/diheme cytochrome c family protein
MKLGATLYERHCADCHQTDGQGVPRIYPPRPAAGSRDGVAVADTDGTQWRIPAQHRVTRGYRMPPYYQALNDGEVAAILTSAGVGATPRRRIGRGSRARAGRAGR